jgi:hypothetical protein
MACKREMIANFDRRNVSKAGDALPEFLINDSAFVNEKVP